MDCKTMKKSWWRRKLSFLGRLLGFKKRSTGGNSSTRNDDVAIDTKMDRPVDNNHTTVVQTRESDTSKSKSAAWQYERRKSNSMTGNGSCQRLEITQHSAEYVARLAPAEDHTASDARRSDSPVNEHGLTVSKTEEKILSGFKSVKEKTSRCQSGKTQIRSYPNLPERSLKFQRSKTEVDTKAVKNVRSKTMTGNVEKIAQRCVECTARLFSTDGSTPIISNSDLRSGNNNGAGLTARNVRIGDDPVVNNHDSTVTRTQKMIQSGFKPVNVRMSRCKSDKTEIKSCQEGKQTHSINCKWSQIAIDMEPVKYYVGPKTTTRNTAITAQNCSEDPSGLAPTDGGTSSIVNSDLRPGNENGAGLPVGDARREDGPVNKNGLRVTVKAREKVRSVTVKASTSTKALKPEVNRGWRREGLPEKTTKSQQVKTGIDTKAVKCNDLSNTIKTRTAANARIRPADAARAAPAARSVPPRIAKSNNPRTGVGPVNKNSLPVTVKAREKVGPVNVKASTSTKANKPEVNRGWRREGLPDKTAKSQQPKTVIDSKAVKCNTRRKAVKRDARAAVMGDGEPIERDQHTVDDADFTTIDRWADVLLDEDLMLLEEPTIMDDFW